jgi:hypothetical protein
VFDEFANTFDHNIHLRKLGCSSWFNIAAKPVLSLPGSFAFDVLVFAPVTADKTISAMSSLHLSHDLLRLLKCSHGLFRAVLRFLVRRWRIMLISSHLLSKFAVLLVDWPMELLVLLAVIRK